MNILLVEDYEEKATDILNFVHKQYPQFNVELCSSYNTAQEKIFEAEHPYDLSSDASGGLPEPDAGQNILEGMFLRNIPTPVIVVTMYNVFARQQLSEFHEHLLENYPQNYHSYVFYSKQRSDWKDNLQQQINEILHI